MHVGHTDVGFTKGVPSIAEILSFEEPSVPAGASPWVVAPAPSAVEIVVYDPRWPEQANALRDRIADALGTRAIRVEHVGSTSVPGLAAKPVIDLDLTVADPADERVWLPRLQAMGFVLTVREPWWHEHRLLQAGEAAERLADVSPLSGLTVNLHVFGPDSPELVKHVVFRNWLRTNAADRRLYEAVKRKAAKHPGQLVMDYNARKQTVIFEIYQRAFKAAGFLE